MNGVQVERNPRNKMKPKCHGSSDFLHGNMDIVR